MWSALPFALGWGGIGTAFTSGMFCLNCSCAASTILRLIASPLARWILLNILCFEPAWEILNHLQASRISLIGEVGVTTESSCTVTESAGPSKGISGTASMASPASTPWAGCGISLAELTVLVALVWTVRLATHHAIHQSSHHHVQVWHHQIHSPPPNQGQASKVCGSTPSIVNVSQPASKPIVSKNWSIIPNGERFSINFVLTSTTVHCLSSPWCFRINVVR